MDALPRTHLGKVDRGRLRRGLRGAEGLVSEHLQFPPNVITVVT